MVKAYVIQIIEQKVSNIQHTTANSVVQICAIQIIQKNCNYVLRQYIMSSKIDLALKTKTERVNSPSPGRFYKMENKQKMPLLQQFQNSTE